MQANRVRPWLACVLAILASVFMAETGKQEGAILFLPAALPAAAAVLFHIRKLQAQLIARAAIWAPLLLCMLIAHLERSPSNAMAMVVSGALALLAAGRVADSCEPGAFQPVAFQRTLTLSLVLAFADTFTLWMWTVFALKGHARTTEVVAFFTLGAITLVSAIGLYRLRMWGLVLGVLANIGIAILFGARLIDVEELRIVFVTTALAQLLVAMPVVAGVLLRRPLEPPAWLLRASRVLVPVALVGVIALAVQPLFGRSILIRIAEYLLH